MTLETFSAPPTFSSLSGILITWILDLCCSFSRPPLTVCQWEKGYTASLLSSRGLSRLPLGLHWYTDGEGLIITAFWGSFQAPTRLPLISAWLQGTGVPHYYFPHFSAWLGWKSGLYIWLSVTPPWWWKGAVLCFGMMKVKI